MYYLLDTHACIWALANQTKLSARVRDILEREENGSFVSTMIFFEIAIKLKIGKLPEFNVSLNEFIDASYRSGFNTLSIKDEHFKSYLEVDFADNHRDPFDRYLLAAAKYENLIFITMDEKFDTYKYAHPIVW